MKLRDVKIGTRLGLGFGTILVLVVCVLGAVALLTGHSRRIQSDGMQRANAKAVIANTMRGALMEGAIAMRNVGLQYSTPDMQREEAKAQAQRKRFQEAREQLAALGLTGVEEDILRKIVELNGQVDAPFQEAIQKVKEYANESAGKLISAQIDPLNQQAIVEIDKLVALQQKAVDDLLQATEAAGQRLTLLLMGMGAVTLLLGGMFSLVITRSIVSPLQDAVAVAKRVAAGRLGAAIANRGKDETSQLLHALSEMDQSLARIVRQVREGTEAMVSSSTQIAAGNVELSGHTEE